MVRLQGANGLLRELGETSASSRHCVSVGLPSSVRDLAESAASIMQNLALRLDPIQLLRARQGCDQVAVIGRAAVTLDLLDDGGIVASATR